MHTIKHPFKNSEVDEKQLLETGEIICQRCHGTGTNPDYLEVNLILKAIDDLGPNCNSFEDITFNSVNRNAPCCLSCYGMKKIDWALYATGNYEQELMDWKYDMQKWFLVDVEPFLQYIHYGEVWNRFNTEKYLHFDLETKRWNEVCGYKQNIDSLRAAYKWLHRFKTDGYWGPESYESIPDVYVLYPELSWEDRNHHIQELKAELILSPELTIDRLFDIKKDLDLFWYHIEDLDCIEIEDNVSRIIPDGFTFIWENILRKFGLPQSYIDLLNSDEINFEPAKGIGAAQH